MNRKWLSRVVIRRALLWAVGIVLLCFCWTYIRDRALMAAVEEQNVAQATLLLKAGANANSAGWPSRKGVIGYLIDRLNHPEYYTERTALMLAATQDEAALLKVLLAYGADVRAQTSTHMTALDWAVTASNPRNVQVLLARGAGSDPRQLTSAVVEAAGDYAETAKERESSLATHRECLRLLLRQGGDINRPDYYHNYALTLAAQAAVDGDSECIRFLLQHGADVHVIDGNGFTPLQWAQQKNNTAIIKCLQAAAGKR